MTPQDPPPERLPRQGVERLGDMRAGRPRAGASDVEVSRLPAARVRKLADGGGAIVAAAWAVIGMSVVTTLYVGAGLLIPIALALLLSFVLSPIVSAAKRLKIPRAPAVVLAVTLAFGVFVGLGAILAGQMGQLAGDLPKYQSTMRDKIQSLRGWTFGGGTLDRTADMLQSLGKEFDAPRDGVTTRPGETVEPGARPKGAPPLVEISTPPPTALENLRDIAGPLIHPMATAGIIVVFVIFILLQREDLRNRFMGLAGSRDIQRTTAAIDDAARRLSRLLLTQLGLNAGFGLAIGLGLWAIGVPSPALWGIVAGVLRFVPYVGAFIGAVFPMALAAAVDPGWTMLIATAALFAVVEPIVGHVIEPLVYGRTAGLSPVAVVVAATFWTALWGPIGLVLATPLTVCLVVLGRHVESLGFLDTLLGDRPALTPPELFYQRMLARDPGEAAEKAQEFLREKSLSAYYEEVAIPALLLAQHDVERGALEGERLAAVKASIGELVEDLDAYDDADPTSETPTRDPEAMAALEGADKARAAKEAAKTAGADAASPRDAADPARGAEPEQKRAVWQLPGPMFAAREEQPPEREPVDPEAVLCIGGRTPVEQAAALIVAQILAKNGVASRAPDDGGAEAANEHQAAVWCVVGLDPTEAHSRLAVRRIRSRRGDAQIVAVRWRTSSPDWNEQGAKRAAQQESRSAKADAVAMSLAEAVKLCRSAKEAVATPAPSIQAARPA